MTNFIDLARGIVVLDRSTHRADRGDGTDRCGSVLGAYDDTAEVRSPCLRWRPDLILDGHPRSATRRLLLTIHGAAFALFGSSAALELQHAEAVQIQEWHRWCSH